jgi:phenylacetate-CoA ligase
MFAFKKIINNIIRSLFELYNSMFSAQFKATKLKQRLNYYSDNINFYAGKGNQLSDYPLTDKNTIQNAFGEFPKKSLFTNVGSTSGTTGSPGRFYRDIKNMAAEQFFLNEYFQWKGKRRVWLRGDEVFPYGSKPKLPYLKIPFFGDIYISSYHLNDDAMNQVIIELQKYNNMVLWAYPASAALLAEYCLRIKVKLTFDVVATSSEKLYEHQAKVIEQAFGVKVKDLYGQGERVAAFYRCDEGHYHEIPDYGHVEYINIEDDLYYIAGTSLHNDVMPLVRYKMNDIFRLSDEPCQCGAKSENIVDILGRQDDYITTPKGVLPGILFAAPFQRLRNIKETQIIQRTEKVIEVLVVKNELFNSTDQELLEHLIYGVITKEVCEIQYVEQLEKDKSGKLRFIINHTIKK